MHPTLWASGRAKQADGLVAFEKIEQQPERLPAWRGELRVLAEHERRIIARGGQSEYRTVMVRIADGEGNEGWGEAAATRFADVAAGLHRAGVQIGSMDAMIAGHALAVGTVLVTNNARHFSRVPALPIENWSKDR